MGKTQFFEWFSKFKSWMTYVEDAKCLRCPLASRREETVHQLKELVIGNRGITTCEVANMLGISFGSVQIILKEFDHALVWPNLCPACCVRSRKELCRHIPGS
jgi:hypothetical protein